MISIIVPTGTANSEAAPDLSSLDQTVCSLIPELGHTQVMIAGGGDEVAAYVADRPGLVHVPLGITGDARADAVRDCDGDTILFLEPGTVLAKGWPAALTKATKGAFGLAPIKGRDGSEGSAYVVKKSAYRELGGLGKDAALSDLTSIATTNGIPISSVPVRATLGGASAAAASAAATSGSASPFGGTIARTQILLLDSGERGTVDASVPDALARKLKHALSSNALRSGARLGSVQTIDAGDSSVGALVDKAIASGADKVLLLDPQVPGVTEQVLRDALNRLDESDLVVGPTDCGQCYLVGLDCGKAGALGGFETGLPISENAIDNHAERAGLRVAKAPELRSCNTIDEFRHFYCSGHINL